MNRREFAIKACAYLAGKGWVDSQRILSGLGTPVEDHNTARGVLKRLREHSVLEQKGVGKYYWRLVNEGYNKDNPMSSTSKTLLWAKKHNDGFLVYGSTYDHRHALSNAGGVWNPTSKEWQFSREDLAKVAHLLGNYKTVSEGDEKPQSHDQQHAHNGNGELQTKLDEMEATIAALTAKIKHLDQARRVELIIKKPNKEDVKFEEQTHPLMPTVLFHLECGDNVMLVGPKGCGKTYLAKQAARVLGIPCGQMSLSGGVTEGKIFGRTTPNIHKGTSQYQSTLFVDIWEGGGLFLLDEIDAADPNVLLSLNGALEDSDLPLDRSKHPIAKRHTDNVVMAAANTWGNGADRQYCGRNQLDGAFVDRFVQLEMDYDKQLELGLCPGWEDGVAKLHQYRENLYRNRVERVIGTRFIKRAFKWVQHGKDFSYVEERLFAGWREDEIRKVKG